MRYRRYKSNETKRACQVRGQPNGMTSEISVDLSSGKKGLAMSVAGPVGLETVCHEPAAESWARGFFNNSEIRSGDICVRLGI
jgi:hypothetical protein